MEEKKCVKCGETKVLSEFSGSFCKKRGKYYTKNGCKACARKYASDRIKNETKEERGARLDHKSKNRNREKDILYGQEYYEKNKEELRKKARERRAESRKKLSHDVLLYRFWMGERYYIGKTDCLQYRVTNHKATAKAGTHKNPNVRKHYNGESLLFEVLSGYGSEREAIMAHWDDPMCMNVDQGDPEPLKS